MNHRSRTTGLAVTLVISLVCLFFTSSAFAEEGKERKFSLGYEADKLENCVEPTEYMRSNHFELLLHERDLTVHEGIRIKKKSLTECVECHVSREEDGKPIPINAEGQFCQRCHNFTAVKIDCFQCHSTVPNPDKGWTAFNHPIVTPEMDKVRSLHQGFAANAQQDSLLDSDSLDVLMGKQQSSE